MYVAFDVDSTSISQLGIPWVEKKRSTARHDLEVIFGDMEVMTTRWWFFFVCRGCFEGGFDDSLNF